MSALSPAAIYDQLVDLLDMKLPEETMLALAEWIAKMIEASYRTGREDGLWEA